MTDTGIAAQTKAGIAGRKTRGVRQQQDVGTHRNAQSAPNDMSLGRANDRYFQMTQTAQCCMRPFSHGTKFLAKQLTACGKVTDIPSKAKIRTFSPYQDNFRSRRGGLFDGRCQVLDKIGRNGIADIWPIQDEFADGPANLKNRNKNTAIT